MKPYAGFSVPHPLPILTLASLLIGMLAVSCGQTPTAPSMPTTQPGVRTDIPPATTGEATTNPAPTGTLPTTPQEGSPTGPDPSKTVPKTPSLGGPASPLVGLAPLVPENAAGLKIIAELEGVLTFSPQGDILAAAKPTGITLFDRETFGEIGNLPCGAEGSCPYAFSTDGRSIAWSPEKGQLAIWDLAAGGPGEGLSGVPADCCNLIEFSSDDRLLALSAFPNFSVFDVSSGEELFRLENVDHAAFSPDGHTLATTSMEAIQIQFWNAASGEPAGSLEGFQTAAPVYSAVFSPDWSHVLWVSRASALLMEVDSGQAVAELTLSAGEFSPDGRLLAGTEHGWGEFPCTGQVCLYDAASGELLSTLMNNNLIRDMEFFPDGRLLATADQNGVTLWDVERGSRLATVPLQDAVILTVSPDGQVLAASIPGGPAQLLGVPSQP